MNHLNDNKLPILPNDTIINKNINVTMIGNNSCINRFFKYGICELFDKIYSQNSSIHWYTSEGMEKKEFEDARNDLKLLFEDYEECLREEVTDEEDEDDF